MSEKKYFQFLIVAPVDAGKTTLSEAILYEAGVRSVRGRVDHQDTLLDNAKIERTRGITVFSKTARFEWNGLQCTLVDTPGHADFTPETERVLSVPDAAVLMVSAADGVTDRVRELFSLLSFYEVPVFFFVNKMDQPGADEKRMLTQLGDAFDGKCVAFSAADGQAFSAPLYEEIALTDEALFSRYLAGELPDDGEIALMIAARSFFPVYFGSALLGEGVVTLLNGLTKFFLPPSYPTAFGARVFRISHDAKGVRLTHLRITGGVLKVRDLVTYADGASEKINEIRLYSGGDFVNVATACAGETVAVTGLKESYPGQGIGISAALTLRTFVTPPAACIVRAEGTDVFTLFKELSVLQEEAPELNVRYTDDRSEIAIRLMGRLHADLITSEMQTRFGRSIRFLPLQEKTQEIREEPVFFLTEEEALALRMRMYEDYVAQAKKDADAKAKASMPMPRRELTNEEVEEIYTHTYGPVKKRWEETPRIVEAPSQGEAQEKKESTPAKSFLLVDGYNVIYADETLRALAMTDMKAARDALVDVLINYRGFCDEEVILVFDAYRVPSGTERIEQTGNISIVYTRQAETADQYIAKCAKELTKRYHVRVATSDALEQIIVYGAGAIRLSAQSFWEEIAVVKENIREKTKKLSLSGRTHLDHTVL